MDTPTSFPLSPHAHPRRGRPGRWLSAAAAVLALAAAGCTTDSSNVVKPPNILFFIMDDVGIDQMKAFGYGGISGDTAPKTPVMDTLVASGLAFRNNWAMPECSPSRAMFFNGRYSIRTNISTAITSSDLANSQMAPWETTTPRILKTVGYENGMFGKAHLAGTSLNPDTNPYGNTAEYQLGWDRFRGWADGAPKPIDTTAGGVAAKGTYSCGYVPTTSADATNGADSGACYTVDNRCEKLVTTGTTSPGRACLERGGILVPKAECQATRPSFVDFTKENAYYVSELVSTDAAGRVVITPPEDPSGKSRSYRTSLEADLAIDWIKGRAPGKPWMATVSFAAAHAPYQPPPSSLLAADALPFGGKDCTSVPQTRVLMNQMIEAIDAEIGRVLVESGVATRNADGSIKYDPKASNTMVVIVGDNGSFAFTVKAPFDPMHAKAYANQTGVWAPLVIAGPLVASPGRAVEAMTNIADLYALFAEFAQINVRDVVPASRTVDAVSMLPYLTTPTTAPLRTYNFTQTAANLRATNTVQSPCVVESANVCTTLFPQQALCEMEGGTWYGKGSTQPGVPTEGFSNCCQVNALRLSNPAPNNTVYSILPDRQQAVRTQNYKLIRILEPKYVPGTDPLTACQATERYEFYKIDQAAPLPTLDRPDLNNLGTTNLSGEAKSNYDLLTAELKRLNDSVASCPGDGNLDGLVNAQDIADFNNWRTRTNGKSTWYDFNLDGLTDDKDLAIIQANLNKTCPKPR